MDLEIQCKFAPYYLKFKKCDHEMLDIGSFLCTLRGNRMKMSFEAMNKMLQIPLTVLNSQCELKENESIWTSKHGYYFSGNIPSPKDEVLLSFKEKFKSHSFTLETIYDFLLAISQSPDYIKSDFYMRNAEVTVRDDVRETRFSYFKESGLIFARILEQAFDL